MICNDNNNNNNDNENKNNSTDNIDDDDDDDDDDNDDNNNDNANNNNDNGIKIIMEYFSRNLQGSCEALGRASERVSELKLSALYIAATAGYLDKSVLNAIYPADFISVLALAIDKN
jgi:hypothetical protein